jgi:heat shock protein HtpX
MDGVRAGVLVAVALMGLAYLVSQRVVLRLCYATPADVEHHPALVQLVEALAHSANIRTPLVAVSALNVPNAFAAMTPGGGVVGVTAGLMEMLTSGELEAVLAHEVAHLQRASRAATIAAVLAAVPGTLALRGGYDLFYAALFRRPFTRGWGGGKLRPLRDLLAVLAVPIAATLVRSSVSWRDELHADAAAVRLTADPAAMVSALRKIQSLAGRVAVPVSPAISHLLVIHPFGDSRLGRLFNCHPPTAERISAIES